MTKEASLPRDSEIVFRDLEHAHARLESAATNPAELRRALRDFVNLTQQLTEVMRREFKEARQRDWVPSLFPGWTPVTSLFKKLRRSNYHEHPFLVDVWHEQVIPFAKKPDGKLLAFGVQYTTEVNDPGRESLPPQTMALELAETGTRLPVAQGTSRCILRGRTKEVRQALESAGTNVVLELSTSCLATLREYYSYYCRLLDAPP